MKKPSKSKALAVPQVDPYLEGMVAKLLERLVGLERKMDIVIAQTAARSSGGSSPVTPQVQQPLRRERAMYEAICADCSKVCEVPFKPTEARPVYCKECWGQRKNGGNKVMNGMPVLTPVALPLRIASRLNAAPSADSSLAVPLKKVKKRQLAKKKKNQR